MVRTRFKTTIKDVKVVTIQAEKTSETSCWFRPVYHSVLPKWYTTNSESSFFERVKQQTYSLHPELDRFQVKTQKRELL